LSSPSDQTAHIESRLARADVPTSFARQLGPHPSERTPDLVGAEHGCQLATMMCVCVRFFSHEVEVLHGTQGVDELSARATGLVVGCPRHPSRHLRIGPNFGRLAANYRKRMLLFLFAAILMTHKEAHRLPIAAPQLLP